MNDGTETTATDAQETATKQPVSTGRRILKWAVVAASLVVLYALVGFVALPKVARSMLPDKLGQALGRTASVGEIRFNPFTLVLDVEDLAVMEADGTTPFASLGLLHADLDGMAVFRLAAGLEELRLVRPAAVVTMDAKGRYNFSDILDRFAGGANATAQSEPDAGGGSGGGFPLLGSNLVIQDAHFEFRDLARGVTHELADLNLAVPFISTLPGDSREWVKPAMSAKLNGRPLVLEGRTRPFEDTLRTEFHLTLDALALAPYRPYVPVDARAALTGGTLSCDLALVFTQGDTPSVSIMGPVRVDGLDVRLDGAPLASFDELMVQVGGVDLDKHLATLDLVRLGGLRATVGLDEQGQPSIAPLLPMAAAPKDGGDEVADASADTASTSAADARPADAAPAFGVLVTRFELDDAAVDFSDKARSFSAQIAPLDASVDGLDTRGGDAAFGLRLGIDGTRLLAVNGTLDPVALTVGGDLALSGLDATRLAPYYADALPVAVQSCTVGATTHFRIDAGADAGADALAVSITNLGVTLADVAARPKDPAVPGARVKSVTLAGGDIDPMALTGSVKSLAVAGVGLVPPKGDDAFATLKGLTLKTIAFDAAKDQPPSASVGSLALDALAVHAPGDADPAVALASLGIGPLAYKDAPQGGTPTLAVGSIAIKAPRLAAAMDEQGIPNIARIIAAATGAPRPRPKTDEEKAQAMEKAEAAAQQSTAAATSSAPDENDLTPRPPALLVTIYSLTVADGEVAFRDASVQPPYATALQGLSGGVQGFSNAPGAPPANLTLSGMVDGHAPLTIESTASPTDIGLNPKAKLLLTDMDLTAVSPYTAKYTSYTLAKGQLSLNLKADVQGRDISGENFIRIKGIELGRYEKSPDDVGIPMPLALALLTDRSGSVELDVPVRGNLDDPNFRLGKVIFGAVMNIIFKAVTSPFALIGGLFGGGEDLDSLPMASGSAALTPSLETKLDTVAKALAERPRLNVEIAGTATPGPDAAALSDLKFRRAVAAPRFLELQEQGKTPDAPEGVALTPVEFPEYLQKAYEAAQFDKPADLEDLPEEQQLAAMERLLRRHLQATSGELADLARQRALTVKNALITRNIAPNRVFLRESTPKDADTTPAGVVLTLR